MHSWFNVNWIFLFHPFFPQMYKNWFDVKKNSKDYWMVISEG